MKAIRLLGNIALWIGALLGVAAGGLFIANKMEIINPLIVISGSMEPGIQTGDLLVDTKVRTADLEIGDVVSLPSELTHKLVSHRIVQIERSDEGPAGTGWKIYMKGDANEFEDIAPYYVGDEVWSPKVQLSQMGVVVSKMMDPGFSLPILLALVALLGFSILSEEPTDEDDEDDEDDLDDDLDPDRLLDGLPNLAPADLAALDEIDTLLASLGVRLDELEPVPSR